MFTRPFKSLNIFRFRLVLAAGLLGFTRAAQAQPDVDGHPGSSAFYLIPPDTDDWTRHFHIGGLVGLNVSGNFHLNGNNFAVSGNNPAKGIYDDGYVRIDETGNAGGLTSFWGYNNSSQYNASAQTLTMHAITGFSAQESANADAGISGGFDLAYGANYWYWKHARVGWELGFDLLPIGIHDDRPISAKANQTTYIFSTGGLILPEAPYQGGSSGVGPLLPTAFATNSASGISATANGSRSLNAIIYSVRLGPSFDWDLGSHVDMSLSAGPVLGVVSGEYAFDENVSVNGSGITAHNHGTFDNVGIQYGGYFNATFMYHLTQSVDFFAGAQYTTMNNYSISAPGRSASLNLSGQVYLTAGISWPF
jgi:hypothetical protein